MAFELMTLPYSYDALEPYMSAEKLHYLHAKHHQAYVDMLNKLLPGSGFEGKSLELIVKASYGKNPGVFAFSFADKKWQKEEVAGGDLPSAVPDSTYVAPMDAGLLVCAEGGKGKKELMYFYKLGEHKWYTAPVTGDAATGVNKGLNHSPHYDPELGLVIRVTKGGHWACDIHVMRLVPEELELTPVAR